MSPSAAKSRVVILGGGFGGAYCAQALEKALHGEDVEILLIDRNNYFVFFPLLAEAGTGSLEPRHAVVSIRAFLKTSRFLMAEVLSLDPDQRSVTYRVVGADSPETIPYDHLVVALGSVTNLPDVPGLAQFGFEIKSLQDAVALRDRAIQMLELAAATPDPAKRAPLLHFVVVGGNFTGVEMAGEFHVFLREATRLYRNIEPSECGVTLVELSGRILGALPPDLSEYAAETMTGRGMSVRLNTSVTAIARDVATLSTGEVLPTRTVIWCAGIASSPLTRRLPFPADARGYILCERDLRVRGRTDVWAIGDCAVKTDAKGVAYAATAQNAIKEGVHLAHNIARAIRGAPTLPFEYEGAGSLAALGCRTGVARVFGVKLSGFPAWFLWRGVYLMKMPGWSRRFRIALDWAIDLLFPRDYVQLGVHRAPPRGGAPVPASGPGGAAGGAQAAAPAVAPPPGGPGGRTAAGP